MIVEKLEPMSVHYVSVTVVRILYARLIHADLCEAGGSQEAEPGLAPGALDLSSGLSPSGQGGRALWELELLRVVLSLWPPQCFCPSERQGVCASMFITSHPAVTEK